MRLPILQPVDYDGEVTGTVVMMSAKKGASHLDTTESESVPSKESTINDPSAGTTVVDDQEAQDGLKRTANGIVLYPQPHDSPNDPLNWPMWRRDLALAVIGFHSFIIGGQTPLLATAFESMSQQFGVSLGTLAFLVGAYMLALGVGSVIFSPIAKLYGKRVVYLAAEVLWIVGAVIAGASNSFSMLMGARILMGLGGAPCEALPSSSIAEIYFLHERAYRLGIYTLLLLGGKNLVPMVAGFVISGVGWNWLFWIQTMIVGMNLVLTYLFVPETFWYRPAIPTDSRSLRETLAAREARMLRQGTVEKPGDSATTRESTRDGSRDIESRAESREIHEVQSPSKARRHPKFDLAGTPVGGDHEDYESARPSARPSMYDRSAVVSAVSLQDRFSRHNLPPPEIVQEVEKRKTFVQTLRLFHGRLTPDKWWMLTLRPIVLLAYPPIFYSTFVYSSSVVWLIVISEVISAIFSKPPYDFAPTSVGLLYISTFLGGCLGSAVAGRASDMIVRIMARRNGGIYEPEFRLVMMVPVFFTLVIGMYGFGWSSFDKDQWIVPTIFLGLMGFGCSLGSTTAITYTVDSYKQFAGESLVTLNFTKNLIGFIFSLFVNIFLQHTNQRTLFLTFGSVEVLICLAGIPMYVYGKRSRHWTDRVNMMRFLYVDDDPVYK